jgi:hypothetical protein
VSARDRAGAGAAGGIGSACPILKATVRPGIDLVLEFVSMADQLPGARLVVAGDLLPSELAGTARTDLEPGLKRRIRDAPRLFENVGERIFREVSTVFRLLLSMPSRRLVKAEPAFSALPLPLLPPRISRVDQRRRRRLQ